MCNFVVCSIGITALVLQASDDSLTSYVPSLSDFNPEVRKEIVQGMIPGILALVGAIFTMIAIEGGMRFAKRIKAEMIRIDEADALFNPIDRRSFEELIQADLFFDAIRR